MAVAHLEEVLLRERTKKRELIHQKDMILQQCTRTIPHQIEKDNPSVDMILQQCI